MNKSYTRSATGILFLLLGSSSAFAEPVDLNTWTVEEYSAGSGNWVVAGDGESVTQTINGNPTFFVSDFNTQGSEFTGNITVAPSGDNDYIGFALGIQPGDANNPNLSADFLLIDWKQGDQTFNFDGTTTTAEVGLAVSRVTGVPDRDELWGHIDATGGTGAVEELQRGLNLGDTGWSANVNYEFTFDFGPNDLEVFVNGIKELDIAGLFNDGRFGFYNFSHAQVTYAGFSKEESDNFPAPPSEVPVPAAVWLFGTALAGFIGFSRRRKVS